MIGFDTLALLLPAAVRTQAGFDEIASLQPAQPHKVQLRSTIVLDITGSGTYDEAALGVEYIVRVAPSLAGNTEGPDYASMILLDPYDPI